MVLDLWLLLAIVLVFTLIIFFISLEEIENKSRCFSKTISLLILFVLIGLILVMFSPTISTLFKNKIFIDLLKTVIAPLIVLSGTILTIRNTFVSKNLFPERAEWRKTMRDLAIKIESTNIVTVQQQAQIRNNINPYGVGTSKSDNEFFLKDGHIHEVLDKLKANCKDQKSIKKLVKYLALLLKYDWERSKNENKFIPFTKISNKRDDKKYKTQVKKIK